MSRLYDRLHTQRYVGDLMRDGRVLSEAEMRGAFTSLVDGAHVFVIDNVAEYCLADTDKEWDLDHDFPCVAPPFRKFWMEYRFPRHVVCHDGESLQDEFASSVGVLALAEAPEDVWPQARWATRKDYNWAVLELAQARQAEFEARCLPVETQLGRDGEGAGYGVYDEGAYDTWRSAAADLDLRWLLRCQLCYEYDAGIYVPMLDFAFLVCRDASIRLPAKVQVTRHPDLLGKDLDAERHLSAVLPVLMALSFLNCRNVSTIEEAPSDRLSRAYQKRQRKRGWEAPCLTRYHTLQIDPQGEGIRSTQERRNTGRAQALHIAHGHFKDYSKGKGLFGRNHGTYWWPSVVRGNPVRGEVRKDYRIRAPRQNA